MIKRTYKSIAKWPVGTISKISKFPNISSDVHPSMDAAHEVCSKLEEEGFGGEHKIFPISTEAKEFVSIEAIFVQELGKWSYIEEKFIDRTSTEIKREIVVIIDRAGDKPILEFIGGPTGFESYYIKDLLHPDNFIGIRGERFCICGGTINRWPECTVACADVIQFLKEEGFIDELRTGGSGERSKIRG